MGVHLPCEDLVPFIGKMNNRFVCGCVVVVFRYMGGRLGVLDKVGDGIIYVGVNGQCLRANARLVPSSNDVDNVNYLPASIRLAQFFGRLELYPKPHDSPRLVKQAGRVAALPCYCKLSHRNQYCIVN